MKTLENTSKTVYWWKNKHICYIFMSVLLFWVRLRWSSVRRTHRSTWQCGHSHEQCCCHRDDRTTSSKERCKAPAPLPLTSHERLQRQVFKLCSSMMYTLNCKQFLTECWHSTTAASHTQRRNYIRILEERLKNHACAFISRESCQILIWNIYLKKFFVLINLKVLVERVSLCI